MRNQDLDQTLNAWFDDVEPRSAPPQLVGGVLETTRRTAQRRRATARWSAAFADARNWGSVRLSPVAAVVIVALLIVALLAAAAVGTRLLSQAGPGWRTLDRSEVDGGFTWVSHVASGGPGLVAVGSTVVPTDDGCGRAMRGRVWTSAGGTDWADQSVALFDDLRLERIVESGNTLYALGTTGASCSESATPSYATAVSTDGLAWTQLPDSAAFDGSFILTLIDVQGTPFALGIYQDAEPPDGTGRSETRVWRLADNAWEQTATIEGVFLHDAAAVAGVVVATGTDQQGRQSVWRSTDGGSTWSITRTDPYRVAAVESAGGRFIAVGDRGAAAGESEPASLVSDDGVEWRLAVTLTGSVHDMWAGDGGMVALSSANFSDECAEWGSPGSVPVAVPTDGTPTALVASPSTPGGSGEVCIRLRQVTDSWYSSDGVSWHPSTTLPELMGDPPELTQPIPASSYSVAVGSEGVVVTSPTFAGRVWFSPLSDFAASSP